MFQTKKKPPRPRKDDPSYQSFKEAQAQKSRDRSLTGRDIGPIPPVADPARKEAAIASFRIFCETYLRPRFAIAWSPDHIKVIDRMQTAVLQGGLFALAMPRGSGKTSLCQGACLWAMLCGYQEFVLLINASLDKAVQSMESIQTELEKNELLAADWPEVCYPIRRLDRIANRCKGQLCQGHPTGIVWTKERIVLPTVKGSKSSGIILAVAGLTSGFRGTTFTRSDGRTVRPSLVIPDDPQTDESSNSLTQCESRERLFSGAILGLAGPTSKIAAVCPCTVIRAGDLADNLLNRELNPEWQGERFKMLYSFPANDRLWDQYADIRSTELKNGGKGDQATEFYRQHRAAMDEGSQVAWPERFNPDEISGLQHAMNLLLRNRRAFFTEYQNDPEPEADEAGQLDPIEIAARVNGLPRALVPLNTSHLTAFVDVQQKLLYWCVIAWAQDFTGSVIDYGAFPGQQGKSYFTLDDARSTLQSTFPQAGLEGAIRSGLDAVGKLLLDREWLREDKVSMKIGKMLVDANWAASTDTVYQWCRTGPYAATVAPSHGKGIGPANRPWSEYKQIQGQTLGFHWLLSASTARQVRKVMFDTNFWKTFIAERLRVTPGDRGALTLFASEVDVRRKADHRMIADHCCAEYLVPSKPDAPKIDVWKMRIDRRDNHWWDGLIGCAVAASMLGCELSATAGMKRERKKVKLSELYAQKHGGK